MTTADISITAAAREAGARAGEARTKPARGLTHKAYLNAFASLLDHAVKGVVMALVTPVLVAGLGSTLFGVWQMLSRLVTYMQAADGRPTQALKWVIANRQAIDDAEEKRRHVGSALGVWLLFLPVLAALSVALVWAAPLVTKVPAELYASVRLTCALLVVNFLLTNLVALPEAVLRGMNLGYRRMGLQAGLSVVGGGLAVGALYAGGGLAGLAAAQVLLAALTGALFLVLVKRFVPWFGAARPSFAEVRSFLRLSVWWFAWSLINKFLMASDILILGFAASAAAVTTYALTNFAGTTLLSLVTTVVGATTPGLGGVVGLKQYDKAAAVRGELMTASWLLLTAAGSVILLCNRSFVTLWVGAEHYAGLWPNLLVVLMCVQLMFIRNDAFVIDLTLELREKVTTGALAALLSVGLSALLIPRLGIAGLCLGMIAGRTVLTVSYPLIVNARFGRRGGTSWKTAARRALTTAALFAASAYLGERVTPAGWLAWGASACAGAGLAFGAAWLAGLNADARSRLAGRLALLRTLRGAR